MCIAVLKSKTTVLEKLYRGPLYEGQQWVGFGAPGVKFALSVDFYREAGEPEEITLTVSVEEGGQG